MVRAIAHTDFKLTWTRKYEPQDNNACTLVSAKPKLIITYTLPKPSKPLQGAMAQNWETFISGVRSHELVHGDFIKDLVKAIESTSVGLSVDADPNCRKIRAELTRRLGELSVAQRQSSRDFDRVELSDGGLRVTAQAAPWQGTSKRNAPVRVPQRRFPDTFLSKWIRRDGGISVQLMSSHTGRIAGYRRHVSRSRSAGSRQNTPA
eukprot:gene10837-13757_t